MDRIVVRVAETSRDGVLLKWSDHSGKERQKTYRGRQTRNLIEKARSELEERLNRPGAARRWSDFEQRVERSYFRGMTPKGVGKPKTMLRRFRDELAVMGQPDIECSRITEEIVLRVQERMEEEGLAKMTVRTNMGALWAVLNWGAENHLLPRLFRPRERVRKGDRTSKSAAKGRALTLEEIERMIQSVYDNPVIRPELAPSLQRVRKPNESADCAVRAIHICRLTGMRLDDCHYFRWEPSDGFHYPENLHGRLPMLVFCPEQKSGQSERIPLTPMAADYLRSIEQPEGFVCRLHGRHGPHATSGRLGRVIANAGRAAGILVKHNGGKMGAPKYASAHDLRRTFAQFLLDHVNIRDAQTMMRHASFETLMRYYSDSSEDALAQKLRSLFASSGGFPVDQPGAVFPETP